MIIIILRVFYDYESSQDSSVSTVTRQWTARPEIRIPAEKRDFLFSKTSRRLWGPPRVLYNDYWVPSPKVKRRGVRLTIYIHQVPGLRMCQLHLHYPVYLHCRCTVSTLLCLLLPYFMVSLDNLYSTGDDI
jgi:hypothetical protein